MTSVITLLLVIVPALSLGAPFTAPAQPAEKVYRVGTLFPPIIHQSFRIEEFRRGLREHGYAEGRNVVLDSRLTGDDQFYRLDLARELVRVPVDVIVTIEIAGGQAARQATGSIPIVVLNCDPHQQLVASLARPGGTSPVRAA